MDYFTKKIVFRKPGFLELEFVVNRKILLTCVILALEAKRLVYKGCEAYLAHVVDTSTLKVTLKSVPIITPRPEKGRHVATVACFWMGSSFPKSNQKHARHLISEPVWKTIYNLT